MVPKLHWNDSVWSVVAFEISWENVKFNGPIGVNQSIVTPVDDLILFDSVHQFSRIVHY